MTFYSLNDIDVMDLIVIYIEISILNCNIIFLEIKNLIEIKILFKQKKTCN